MVRPLKSTQQILGSAALVIALVASSAVPAAAVVPGAESSVPSATTSELLVQPSVQTVSTTTATPEIVGIPVVGQRLSLTAQAPAGAQIQWLRDGAPITGATAASYQLVLDDACALITARQTESDGTVTVSQPVGPIEVPVSAMTQPVVTGTYAVGQTLTATAGSVPSRGTVNYQWLRDGVAITGATQRTYTLTPSDIGRKITVKVVVSVGTCTLPAMTSSSASATIVAGGALAAAVPTITGTVRVGQTLTANRGTWTAGTTFRQQWYRNGVAITGATGTTYKLVAADRGTRISVRVTGSKTGHTTTTKLSSATALVAYGTLTAPTPTISSTARVGQTLTANRGTWTTGTTLRQQWYRNGVAIPGATGTTYRLVAADRGTRITVKVTGTQAGYNSATKASGVTAIVGYGTLTAPTPTISGTARVGQLLTANRGTWTTGTNLRQQWYRNGVAISGATGTTYRLVAADRGTRITVKVTGTQAGYNSATKTSGVTAIVGYGILTAPAPTISGTARVGQLLTANRGTWTSATTLRQQWYRNGVAISGATGTTYRLVAADRGTRITVKVTGSKTGYTTAAKTSGVTAIVAYGVLTAPVPKITGTAKSGYTLTANRGTWTSGTTLRQQWYRNGVAISGATGTAYKLTTSDRGKTITVKVTGSKAGYTSVARTSAGVKVATVTTASTGSGRAAPIGTSCPAAYPIKGNASSMIYHMPYGAYYSRTTPEACFATESAAQAAGYRKSKL